MFAQSGIAKPVGIVLSSLIMVFVLERAPLLRAVGPDEEPTEVVLVSSVPPFTPITSSGTTPLGTLWRIQGNVIRLDFDGSLPFVPLPGEVRIEVIRDCAGCWVGGRWPDISDQFIFEIEGDSVLRIEEVGHAFFWKATYQISNDGSWSGVAPFAISFPVWPGDVNGDRRTLSGDVLAVAAGVPCIRDCGDQNRLDVDGDGRVLSRDVLLVSSMVPLLPCPHPCGH